MKVKELLANMIFCFIFIFILLKACGPVSGDSDEEVARKAFLNEFLELNETTWSVVRDCKLSEFNGKYFFYDEYSIDCSNLYRRLISSLSGRSMFDPKTRLLIELQRSTWLQEISKLDINLNVNNIKHFYDHLEKNVHYCTASSLIIKEGQNVEEITHGCILLAPACLTLLRENEQNDLGLFCEPVSSAILGALLREGVFNN